MHTGRYSQRYSNRETKQKKAKHDFFFYKGAKASTPRQSNRSRIQLNGKERERLATTLAANSSTGIAAPATLVLVGDNIYRYSNRQQSSCTL